MEPMLLTADGDYLEEYLHHSPNSGREITEDTELPYNCVGIHKTCNGCVDRKEVTESYDILHCRGCGLRVMFPNTINTFGELRGYLDKKRWTIVNKQVM